MRTALMAFTTLCLSVLSTGQILWAQEGADEDFMKRWTEFMTPGESHELLKFKEGKWSMNVKIWMDPSAPPVENPATSEAKLIMDGRYLLDKVHGSFNGMPFEGMGTTAYDNARQKFVATWIDNMGTGIMIGEGDFDAQKKTWNYTATQYDPVSGKTVKTRSVERITSEDSWVMESYMTGPDGKEVMTMEISYERDK